MSDTVKLSAKLAKDDDLNGLDSLAEVMINEPRTARVAVIWFDCSKIVLNPDDDSEVPYARIRRFEPIGEAGTMPEALQKIIENAAQERTGKLPLPFDAVDGFDAEADAE